MLPDSRLPLALKRAEPGAALDPTLEQRGLWHQEWRSLSASRQHLLNEAETLLLALPEEIREVLPRSNEVRPQLQALAALQGEWDGPTRLRMRLLRERHDSITELDRRVIEIFELRGSGSGEQIAVRELAAPGRRQHPPGRVPENGLERQPAHGQAVEQRLGDP